MSKKAVFFDKLEFNYISADAHKLCNMVNQLVKTLKAESFFFVELNADFVPSLFNTNGDNIIAKYSEHIKPYLEQSNDLMRNVAVESSSKNHERINQIIQSFFDGAFKLFRNHGNLHASLDAIRLSDGVFTVDTDVLNDLCTTFVSGDALAIYDRVQNLIKEINDLETECKRVSGGKYSLLTTPQVQTPALLEIYQDGKIDTHFDVF